MQPRSTTAEDTDAIRRLSRHVRSLPAFAAIVACAATLFAASCSGSSARDPRYPRRPPGCALAIYHSPVPEVPTWDDLGVARVDCYIDESEIACLSRLRTEACRMGGDVIYDVPKRALRPVERGMIYQAKVAHTRGANKKDDTPAASADAGPVVPLPAAAEPVTPIAPAKP